MARTRLATSSQRTRSRADISHLRAEGLLLKLCLGGLIGLVLLIAVIWGGRRFYLRWQEKRLTQQAETAMQHGDVVTASLAARAALQFKPDSIPAARIAAAIAERSGDQSALVWRRKVAQSNDRLGEDVLALARSALQFNDLAAANTAIATLAESERQNGGYHAVAALIAQAQKQNDKAAAEWEEAARLSPHEKSYQLQLGAAQLRLVEPARRASGEKVLDGLRTDPKYRTAATRILIQEGIARHERVDRILEWARKLRSDPEATFSDKLLVADLLRQANDAQFASLLTELEQEAVGRADNLAALLSWMGHSNLNVLAVEFAKTLKPESLEAWPVPLAMADIYVRLSDWQRLEAAVKSRDWRRFEFLRHAYVTRALRELNKPAAAEPEWTAAIKGATTSDQMLTLIRTVAGWGWRNEEIDLLWAMAKFPDKEKDAIQSLYRYYVQNHDTHGLYRVLMRMAELHPDDLDVANNLAQVSLLLEAKTEDARRTAAEIYQKRPNNPAYATTYAYALLVKGDRKGAAKVMSALTDE